MITPQTVFGFTNCVARTVHSTRKPASPSVRMNPKCFARGQSPLALSLDSLERSQITGNTLRHPGLDQGSRRNLDSGFRRNDGKNARHGEPIGILYLGWPNGHCFRQLLYSISLKFLPNGKFPSSRRSRSFFQVIDVEPFSNFLDGSKQCSGINWFGDHSVCAGLSDLLRFQFLTAPSRQQHKGGLGNSFLSAD